MTRCGHKFSVQQSGSCENGGIAASVGLHDLMEKITLSKEIKTVLAVRRKKKVNCVSPSSYVSIRAL